MDLVTMPMKPQRCVSDGIDALYSLPIKILKSIAFQTRIVFKLGPDKTVKLSTSM